eukprot:tig00020685_g12956.t1
MGREVFLSAADKVNIAQWTYSCVDLSITTRLLSPFWNAVVRLIPSNVERLGRDALPIGAVTRLPALIGRVLSLFADRLSSAPNVLSFAGLLCIVHGYYIERQYLADYPALTVASCIALIFAYQTLDAIDGKHARATRNGSPMGELFDHACDNVGITFLALTVLDIMGVTDSTTQWMITQSVSLLFLCEHMEAFKERVVSFSVWLGPGELLVYTMAGLALRAYVGLEAIWGLYAHYMQAHVLPTLARVFEVKTDLDHVGFETVRLAYLLILVHTIIKAVLLKAGQERTRNGLLLCLLYRVVPLLAKRLVGAPNTTDVEILADGLTLSLITSDLIVAKMAKRDLHPLIVIACMVSIFNDLGAICLCAFYYFEIFYELSEALNMPVFSTVTNVYIDGIYDLCHVGHKNLFAAASKYGNRLLVGVCSDEDATPYKRKPIMTHEERCAEVAACKHVSAVIPNAPCSGIPREFLVKHNIHVVCHSAEYDRPDDAYYAVPRQMGITRVLPRTEGISTSDLIHRCKLSGLAQEERAQALAAFQRHAAVDPARAELALPRGALLAALGDLDGKGAFAAPAGKKEPKALPFELFLEAVCPLGLGLRPK